MIAGHEAEVLESEAVDIRFMQPPEELARKLVEALADLGLLKGDASAVIAALKKIG